MKKYNIYLGGVWFFEHEATNAAKAIELTKDQI